MRKTCAIVATVLGLGLAGCEQQRGTRRVDDPAREAKQETREARQEARQETAEARQEAREETAEARQKTAEARQEAREEAREETAEARQEGRELRGEAREGVREVGDTLTSIGTALGDAADAAGDKLDDATVHERRDFVDRTKKTLAVLEGKLERAKPTAEEGSKELAADIRRLTRELRTELDLVGKRSGKALDRTTDEVEKDLKDLRARVNQANDRGVF